MTRTARTISVIALSFLVGKTGRSAPPSITHDLGERIASQILKYPPRELTQAVALLASPDFITRESAQRDIERMGITLAPYLPVVRKSVTDAEARRRLDAVTQKLHWNNIAVARTLSFSAEKISAPDALRMIANKAGYRMRIDPLGDDFERKRLYDFSFPSLTFWEAIDRVCNESGLVVTPEDDGALRASYQDTFNPFASYSGPFRFVPAQVYSGRYMQLGGLNRRQLPAKNQENLTINLNVTSEPKTPIVGVRGCTISKIIDQDGKELPQSPIDERVSQYYGGQAYKTFTQNLNINFTRPSVESTSLKLVSGKASLMVLTEAKPDIVVSDLLKSKGRKFRGRSAQIDITDVVEAKGAPLSVVVTFHPLNATQQIDYNSMNSISQKLEACDAAGRPYLVSTVGTNFSSEGSVILTLQLLPPEGTKPGPPATLTLVEWITRSMEIDFEFRDVPLP